MNPPDLIEIGENGEVLPAAKATVTKVTRALSGDHVVDVHFLDAPTAMSGAPNGSGTRVVILPKNMRAFADDPAQPRDSGYERLLALSFHESAHHRFTDLEAYSNGSYIEKHVAAYHKRVQEVGEAVASEEMPTEAELRSDLFRCLANIVEDARVDRINLMDYPGTEKKTRGLHNQATSKYRKKLKAGCAGDLEMLLFAASDRALEVALPGSELLPLPGWADSCIASAEGEIRAGVLSADFAQAIDHTVLAYLAIRKQLQSEGQEDSQSKDSDEGSHSDQRDPRGGDADSEPDPPESDTNTQSRSEGPSDSEVTTHEDVPPIGPDDLTKPIAPQSVATGAASVAPGPLSGRRASRIAGVRREKEFEDLERVVRLSDAVLAGGIEAYRKAHEGLESLIRESATRLRSLLVESGRVRFRDGFRTGNRLASRKLYRVAIPGSDLRLCERRHLPERFDYAVSLLVDLSGSMSAPDGPSSRTRIECARDAMILLAEVLSQAEVAFEMLGFTTDTPGFVPAKIPPVEDEPVHVLFKEYDEPLSDEVRRRIGAIRAWANNYDGVAVALAARRLLRRPERSKMMFVASDGVPAGNYAQPIALRQAVVDAEKRNLMVFGIGIGRNDGGAHIAAYYDRSAVIDDASKLGQRILDMVQNAMKTRIQSILE